MKIVLALLLLAGADWELSDRWDAVMSRGQEREAIETVTRVAPPSHYRPQDKPKERAERVKHARHHHHHRATRFKCHRVYVTKHRWHCQRGRGK